MTTIVDVARAANVSTSTVSHVVNETRNVAPETRDRVLAAIAMTGYRQHHVARALRRSRTDTLALVISEAGYPVLDQMALGVEHQAKKSGMMVFLAHSGDDPDQELAAVLALRDRGVDGVLLAPVGDSRPQLVTMLQESSTPLVLIDRPSPIEVDQVGVENVAPMFELVEHLIDVGHRRVLFAGQGRSVSTLSERHEGYASAMQQHGLDAAEVHGERPGELRQIIRAELDGHRPPTAIVCASQMSAVLTLQAINDLGLRVPVDVSLVTFDEFPYAEVFSPRLTSVVQPAMRIGREAVRLLSRRLAKPTSPVRRVRIRPTIEYRDSTAPIAGV